MLRDFRVLNHLSSLFSRLPCVDCLQIFLNCSPVALYSWPGQRETVWNYFVSRALLGVILCRWSSCPLKALWMMNVEGLGRSKFVRDFFKIFAVANSWFLERSSFLTARKWWKIIRGATQTHQVAYLRKPSLQNLQMFTCYQCCAQHVAATETTLQFCNIHQYSI